MAETVRDNALLDVDEIWGSEVNLYLSKYMQVQLIQDSIKESQSDLNRLISPRKKNGSKITSQQAYALAHNELYGTDAKKALIPV